LNFLFFDFVVLIVLVLAAGESLPWEGALEEVKEDVSDRLHVVSSGLLDSDVSVDRGVPCSSGQRLVVTVWNMRTSLSVFVSLGEAKIDHVTGGHSVTRAHQEVIWLHVSMQEVVDMEVFETSDHLISQHTDRLQSEATSTVLEEVFKGVAE